MRSAAHFTFIVFCSFISCSALAQGKLRYFAVDSTTNTLHKSRSLPIIPQATAPTQLVPPNFYAQHLAFFCRQELKMQQARVPLTFRLGSMDDCNRLEQKPGYR